MQKKLIRRVKETDMSTAHNEKSPQKLTEAPVTEEEFVAEHFGDTKGEELAEKKNKKKLLFGLF